MLQLVARQGLPTHTKYIYLYLLFIILYIYLISSGVTVKIEKQEAVQNFWNKFNRLPPETSDYLLLFPMLSLLLSLSGIW